MNIRPTPNTGVYKIQNIINKKQYIGSSACKIGSRWSWHRKALRTGNHHSILLQRAWNKYGEVNFVFERIEACSPETCLERKQFYMDTLKPEYNICKVAGSPLGRKTSEKTKEKLRVLFSGQNNPFYGKTHTDETRKKLSLALIGRMKGVLVGEKNPMYKKTHTEENKKVMSEKSHNFWTSENGVELKEKFSLQRMGKQNHVPRRGKEHPRYNPTKYNFINEKTNEIFYGDVLDFRKKYSLSEEIYYLVGGKYNQYKGWKIQK